MCNGVGTEEAPDLQLSPRLPHHTGTLLANMHNTPKPVFFPIKIQAAKPELAAWVRYFVLCNNHMNN